VEPDGGGEVWRGQLDVHSHAIIEHFVFSS